MLSDVAGPTRRVSMRRLSRISSRLPGEMNGFLKPVESLLAERLHVAGGLLVLPPDRVAILLDRLEQYRVPCTPRNRGAPQCGVPAVCDASVRTSCR